VSETLETVTAIVNGKALALQSITISVSAEEAVRSASADLAWPHAGLPCRPDDEAMITAGGTVILTGFVRDVSLSRGAEQRGCRVTFVSRTVDATETSVEHPDGELVNVTLPDIAAAFDTLGIGVEDDGSAFPVEPRHRLKLGESLFATLERRARSRGVLIRDTAEGKLKLATRPEGVMAGTLDATRIVDGSSTVTARGRHSKITVRGQMSEGVASGALRAQGVFEDPAARRPRPLIRRHSGEATSDRLEKRAAWEARRAAGHAATANVTVTGWRDSGGRLFEPNHEISVSDAFLALDGLMVIKSVTLAQDDDNGTLATLALADPRALGGENPRGQTDGALSAPAADKGRVEAE